MLLALALCLGLLPGSALAEGSRAQGDIEVNTEGMGLFGRRFVPGATPLQPQYDIYKRLLTEFNEKGVPYVPTTGGDTVSITWQTTPLVFSTDLRDEALEALSLDHPELDLSNYQITKWTSTMPEAYVAILTLELTKKAPAQVTYDYATRLAAGRDAVRKAGGDYAKVMAAVDWLMEHAEFDKAAFDAYRLAAFPSGSAFAAEGVFSYGKAAYQGFAKALVLLLEDSGVEHQLARGSNTMWVYVQLDGNWYIVDLGAAARYGGRSKILGGSGGYAESEPIGTRMANVGKGTGISASGDPYLTEAETFSVTVDPAMANGTVTVHHNKTNAEIPSGTRVPSGTGLKIVAAPAQDFGLVDLLPRTAYEYVDENTRLLTAVREDILIRADFKGDRVSRAIFEVVKPSNGMALIQAVPDPDGSSTAEPNLDLAVGKNFVPPEYNVTFLPRADEGYQLTRVLYQMFDADPLTGGLGGENYRYIWGASAGDDEGKPGYREELKAEGTPYTIDSMYLNESGKLTFTFEPDPDAPQLLTPNDLGTYTTPELSGKPGDAGKTFAILVVQKGTDISGAESSVLFRGEEIADNDGSVRFSNFELLAQVDADVYIKAGDGDYQRRFYILAQPGLVPAKLTIGEVAAVEIPASGTVDSERPTVTATAMDGTVMTSIPGLTWSMVGSCDGVSIAPDTGVLTVSSTAKAGVATIRAAAGLAAATQTVTLNALGTYPVDITVQKDGGVWRDHGKSLVLIKANGTALTDLQAVPNGSYEIQADGVNTGVPVEVKGGAASATLDYYTLTFSAGRAGTATAARVTATYGGSLVSTGSVVLGGKALVLTAAGEGASAYTYLWTGGGKAETLAIDPVTAKVDEACTVTGRTALSGSLSLTGDLVFGERLSAGTANVSPAGAIPSLTYQWTRGGTELGEGQTYTLAAGDIGAAITLTVTGAGDYYGALSHTTSAIAKAPQGAPEEELTGEQPTSSENRDGRITGLSGDKKYQYKLDSAKEYTQVPDGSGEIGSLVPGAYQVRYGETDTHLPGTAVTVEVRPHAAPPTEEKPQAEFNAGTMTLSGLKSGMQYSVDGGTHWETAMDTTVTLEEAALSPAHSIQVYQPGDDVTTSNSEMQIIRLTRARAPVTVGKVDATGADISDGALTGLSADMEYRGAGATAWTAAAAPAVTGLPTGDYLVRVAGSGTVLPSEAVPLTIGVTAAGAVAVTGVELDKTSLSFYSDRGDQTAQLTATVLPADASNKGVTWASDKLSVATVSPTGQVRVVGDGTAKIAVTTAEGGFTAACTVTVSTYSSGGSGGGGSGGGSRPKDDVEIETKDGVTTIKLPVSGGGATVKVSVSDGNMDKLIAEARKHGSGSVVVAPGLKEGVKDATVEFSHKAVTALREQTGSSLTIQTPAGAVTLLQASLFGVDGKLSVGLRQTEDRTQVSIQVGGKAAGLDATVALPGEDGNVALKVHPDGREEPVPYSVVRNGKVLALVEGGVTLRTERRNKYFDDTAGQWSEPFADFGAARELFQGVAPRTFAPTRSIDRGMLTTILFRLAGQPDTEADIRFGDVPADVWYSSSVAWAGGAGLVNGMGGGVFAPEADVTREQFAAVLHRYAQTMGMDGIGDGGSLVLFSDRSAVSQWAEGPMAWAVSRGIVAGQGATLLAPGSPVTRAEAAAMLQRFIELRVG